MFTLRTRDVSYLDTITVQLPHNPTTRRLGLAGQVRTITVGQVHARIHHGDHIQRIALHEAGIVGDPHTGNLTLATTTPAPPAPPVLPRQAPPQAPEDLGVRELIEVLGACPSYADVVIGSDHDPTPHPIGRVQDSASGGSVVITFGTTTGSTSGSATLSVTELTGFLTACDAYAGVRLAYGNTRYGIEGVALSSDHYVWLLAGTPRDISGNRAGTGWARLISVFQR